MGGDGIVSDERIRVLYVDDDQGLLDLTKTYLERRPNLRVETASCATTALDRYENESFDCIVSDYQMPNVDGLEFLNRIRTNLNSTTPFIIFTGNSREEVAIEALNLGATRYLQKGGDPQTQFGILADAIEQTVAYDRTAKQARKYETRLKQAQKIGHFGILDWKLASDEVHCSDELRKMFDLPKEGSLTIRDIEAIVHPEDRDRIEENLEVAIANETECELEYRVVHSDGNVLWIQTQAGLVRNQGGDVSHFVGIAFDITSAKDQQPSY
ncbi:response regulator [Haloarcula sp. Atlit-47R]|uniref:response regulator n=1 Tax=Haloarcula sp. Atlit-47R TaxID=2282132 RepID=UPI000EF27D8B|nr:response regulator [Haloarcula sp. Atlit-47R]RLM41997.1 response regulator [Haloarcula sp. Atlit-47R]